MRKLKIILQCKYLVILFLLVIVISIIRINVSRYQSIYDEGLIKVTMKVQSIKYDNNKDVVIFSGKENLISYYKDFPYDVGDIVKIEGTIQKIKPQTIPNLFDYKDYLRGKNIYCQLDINKIIVLKKNNNFLNSIQTMITKRLEKMPNKAYFYAFILGNTSYFNKDLRDIYAQNGLVYLLSIGSFQIMFLSSLLSKLTKRISKKKRLIILTISILMYFWLTNYVIGVLRSGLCYLLKKYLNFWKIKLPYTNIILLVGLLLLIIRPFYLQEIGFQYSFFISLGLSIWKSKLSKKKIICLWQLGILAFLFSFPITIYHNYEVNLLTIIISPIFLVIFNFILYPLCIITFILPNIIPVFNFIVSIIEKLNLLFNKMTFLTLIFSKMSCYLLIIYCLLILFIKFYKKRSFTILLILIFFHLNINLFINEKSLTFLDVGEGDAIVIKNGNNLYLVDNGGSEFKEYSDEIIKYVHSLGFKKINKMFLTHGDTDHIGSSLSLLDKIAIDSVYFNYNAINNNELDIIEKLKEKKIFYRQISHYELRKNNLLLKVFSYNLEKENDSSMIIYLNDGNYQILLMGDATISSEKLLLNEFFKQIDILKVGHHGSKTSTSKEFMETINPQYSIISVGKNNFYHLPNQEVLERLKKTKIYRTDQSGSIVLKMYNNKLKINTYSP